MSDHPTTLTEAEREALTSVFAGVIYVRDREALFAAVEKIVAARTPTAETRAGVGTGAGEGATGQVTGTAWVTRSEDCPEAPAQAHPRTPTATGDTDLERLDLLRDRRVLDEACKRIAGPAAVLADNSVEGHARAAVRAHERALTATGDAEERLRDLTRRLGFGDNITEPQADNDTIVAWFEERCREADEWRESQRWRDDCYAKGHPDGEDCWECDPALRLIAAERAAATGDDLRDRVTALADEGLLWSYLDEYLNANGAVPQVAGQDADGTPFLAWLDEEGGDCVGLRVVRLVMDDGGATSTPRPIEAPRQGQTSALRYPIALAASPAPVVSRPEAAVKAEALREAANEVGPALANEVGGHTSTRSVRRYLRERAASLATDPEAGGDS